VVWLLHFVLHAPHAVGPSVPVSDRSNQTDLARMWHVRRRRPTGKVPASRPQHRGAGSRRANTVCKRTFELSRPRPAILSDSLFSTHDQQPGNVPVTLFA